MSKHWMWLVAAMMLTGLLATQAGLSGAAPPAQDDPAAQCAEGVQLAFEGQLAEAFPLLETGFAGREGAAFDHPENLGQCALVLGLLRQDTGDGSGALEAYTVALNAFQASDNTIAEGYALSGIGSVHRDQNRYQVALAAYEQALAISRELEDRGGEGTILIDIGLVYQNQGRYTHALTSYEQALIISRELDDRASQGIIINNMGAVYQAQGRYAQALLAFQQALVIYRQVADRTSEAGTLNNMGEAYRLQGRLPEALDNFQEALAIYREAENRSGEANALNSVGAVYEAQGASEQALENFELAREIWQEVGNRVGEGGAVSNIASVYLDWGRYDEALAMYQQALIIRREVGDQFGEAITLNNIGETYRLQGRYAQALESYQQALDVARQVGDQTAQGSILDSMGAVHEAQGQVAEALRLYQEAMDTLETVRAAAGSELGRASFIARYAGLYASTVDLLDDQGQDQDAFFTSERGRARAFLDSLAAGQVQLEDDASAELLAGEQEAYAVRQSAQDALARARGLDPPDPGLVADLEAQLAEAEAAYEATLGAIEARAGQLTALIPGRIASQTVLGVSEVRAMLNKQTTLVSYFVLEDKTLVFLITQDSFDTLSLDVTPDQLATQIRTLRDFPSLDVAHPDSAVTLYTALVAPLKEHLKTPHLAIIPHNVLHYLPFAALTDGERYLIDDYFLTTLPSASALPFIQENAHLPGSSELPGRSPLILGNPVTGDFDATASFATTRDGLRSLPFAEQEAKIIAALYGVEPLLGQEATEWKVREGSGKAGIVHLAAHGYYNPVAPLSSLIALAPDDPSTDTGQAAYDGWLTVGEVYGLDLGQADLVVLSACQTNLGDLSEGDELVGLTRAFIFAGTPTVVASLWSVEDESTALLMEHFYSHLQEGMGKAEALRQAQLEMREEYPNTYYWAGFVLTGDPGEASSFQPPAQQTTVTRPVLEAATTPVEEMPTPTERGKGLCPASALMVALGMGLVMVAKRRISP